MHLLHTRLWLEGHAKELLEPHGDLCNIASYSLLLLDADSASSEINTHSGMLFSSNTETVVQNSSTTTSCALLHSTVLTRDWLLQNFQQNCFHDTYLYFQKYCVWTSFHCIQFRSSLRSLVVPGSAVRMQLPCGLVCLHNMKMFFNTEDHSKSICAYWIYHKCTHDTEFYVFFWIILFNNTVS